MFSLGHTVMTRGIAMAIDEGILTYEDIHRIILRHVKLQDDNIYPEDRELNLEAIKNNCGRVLTVHQLEGIEKIYCITEGLGMEEYLNTCVLFADEY